MAMVSLGTFDALLRDMYPQPGERIKQWVVDMRRESQWESETCPRVFVAVHDDNTGAVCRNAGSTVPWTYLAHDCCSTCCEMHEALQDTTTIQEWLTLRAARPPVEEDRTKLSDEVQPDIGPIPSFGMEER